MSDEMMDKVLKEIANSGHCEGCLELHNNKIPDSCPIFLEVTNSTWWGLYNNEITEEVLDELDKIGLENWKTSRGYDKDSKPGDPLNLIGDNNVS